MKTDAGRCKLAFVVSMYYAYGGMQRTLLRIARECAARGHGVRIFTGAWNGPRPEDLTVHELDTGALTNHGSNRRLANHIREVIVRQGFDCITGFTRLPGLDVYYAADPCFRARLHEEMNPLFRYLPRYREMARQEAAVFAANGHTEILLVNPAEQEKFKHYYATPPERFHQLPPGIARDRMAGPDSPALRAGFRSEFGLQAHEDLLLQIGTNFPLKGLDRTLRAVHALPAGLRTRVRVFVVGEDNPRHFNRLAARFGLSGQVRFFPGRSDIPRFLAGADLLVHPARRENTGTVILEAMVAGLPVLVSGTCGFARHVVQADAGEVLPEPFSQAQMNRRLAAVLNSGQLQAWSANGVRYGRDRDLYSLVDKAADIIIARARHHSGRRP